MLVSEKTANKWFQTDSWVCKNFIYLFKNPLWNKRVPQRFPICPFFQLSLLRYPFQMFVVFPIVHLILPIMKLIGKPATAIDNFFANIFGKFVEMPEFKGQGFLALFIFVCLALGSAFIVLLAAIECIKWYPYIKSTAITIFLFWSSVSFISLFGVISVHKKITKTECKTKYYLVLWAVLFIIASFIFIPKEIITFLSNIWSIIAYLISSAFYGTWTAIKFTAFYAWVGLKWSPAFHLPWIAFIIIPSIIAYVVSELFIRFSDKIPSATISSSMNTQINYERNRNEWIEFFIRILKMKPHWGYNQGNSGIFSEVFHCLKSPSHVEACCRLNELIYHKAFEIYYADKLIEFQKTQSPHICSSDWSYLKKQNVEDRFAYASTIAGNYFRFSSFDFKSSIIEASNSPEISNMIANVKRDIEKEWAILKSKEERKKNSWSYRTCLRVTTKIATNVIAIKNGIKWVWEQNGIFLSHMWLLIKAYKQKACPVFEIHNPPTNQTKKELKNNS